MLYEYSDYSVTRTGHMVYFRSDEHPTVCEFKKQKKAEGSRFGFSKDVSAWLAEHAAGYHVHVEWCTNPRISIAFATADEAQGFVSQFG